MNCRDITPEQVRRVLDEFAAARSGAAVGSDAENNYIYLTLPETGMDMQMAILRTVFPNASAFPTEGQHNTGIAFFRNGRNATQNMNDFFDTLARQNPEELARRIRQMEQCSDLVASATTSGDHAPQRVAVRDTETSRTV